MGDSRPGLVATLESAVEALRSPLSASQPSSPRSVSSWEMLPDTLPESPTQSNIRVAVDLPVLVTAPPASTYSRRLVGTSWPGLPCYPLQGSIFLCRAACLCMRAYQFFLCPLPGCVWATSFLLWGTCLCLTLLCSLWGLFRRLPDGLEQDELRRPGSRQSAPEGEGRQRTSSRLLLPLFLATLFTLCCGAGVVPTPVSSPPSLLSRHTWVPSSILTQSATGSLPKGKPEGEARVYCLASGREFPAKERWN